MLASSFAALSVPQELALGQYNHSALVMKLINKNRAATIEATASYLWLAGEYRTEASSVSTRAARTKVLRYDPLSLYAFHESLH